MKDAYDWSEDARRTWSKTALENFVREQLQGACNHLVGERANQSSIARAKAACRQVLVHMAAVGFLTDTYRLEVSLDDEYRLQVFFQII